MVNTTLKERIIGDTKLMPIKILSNLKEDSYLQSQRDLTLWFDGSDMYVINKPRTNDALPSYLNTRQKKALKILAGIKGIPKLYFENETKECIREFVIGERLDEHPQSSLDDYNNIINKLPHTFFEDLSELVSKIHSRGVANLGLGKPSNIIITKYSREPSLIEFELSVFKDSFFGWLYPLAEKSDIQNIYKLKQIFRPEELTPHEKQLLEKNPEYDFHLNKIKKQIRLEQLVLQGKQLSDKTPLLSYTGFLIESILKNYTGAEEE